MGASYLCWCSALDLFPDKFQVILVQPLFLFSVAMLSLPLSLVSIFVLTFFLFLIFVDNKSFANLSERNN